MFLTALISVLTLGAAVFCVLTVAQSRAGKRLDNDLVAAFKRNEEAVAGLAESLAQLNSSLSVAVDAVTYPTGKHDLQTQSQADINKWTALAPAKRGRSNEHVSWRTTGEPASVGAVRRNLEALEAQASAAPTKLKAARRQNSWVDTLSKA